MRNRRRRYRDYLTSVCRERAKTNPTTGPFQILEDSRGQGTAASRRQSSPQTPKHAPSSLAPLVTISPFSKAMATEDVDVGVSFDKERHIPYGTANTVLRSFNESKEFLIICGHNLGEDGNSLTIKNIINNEEFTFNTVREFDRYNNIPLYSWDCGLQKSEDLRWLREVSALTADNANCALLHNKEDPGHIDCIFFW